MLRVIMLSNPMLPKGYVVCILGWLTWPILMEIQSKCLQVSIGLAVFCIPWLRWKQPDWDRPIKVSLILRLELSSCDQKINIHISSTLPGQPHLPHHLHPGHHLHNRGPHDNHSRGDGHRPRHHRLGGPGVLPLHRLGEQTSSSPENERLRDLFTSETVCGDGPFQDRVKQGGQTTDHRYSSLQL